MSADRMTPPHSDLGPESVCDSKNKGGIRSK